MLDFFTKKLREIVKYLGEAGSRLEIRCRGEYFK